VDDGNNNRDRVHVCHRYDFPFVFADDDEPVGTPFILPLVLVRGFFTTFASLASFMTIFACISSSFPAFTFFGQNRVTNLGHVHYVQHPRKLRTKYDRLTSIDVVAIYFDPLQRPAWFPAQSRCDDQWQQVIPSRLQLCRL